MKNIKKKTRFNILKLRNERHPFHLVERSPWPFSVAWAVFSLVLIFVAELKNVQYDFFGLKGLPVMLLFYSLTRWFLDIITESRNNHTLQVRKGIKLGMKLFIASEVMFFFSFFWAFFHSALSPSIWIGGIWPPVGIQPINPWGLPFLNTILLISSGVSLTWSHRALFSGHLLVVKDGLIMTILLGLTFSFCQLYEYKTASFSINDGIYGSVFYMATGFHGFHVLVGTIMLIICYLRAAAQQFSRSQHMGFEISAWYWHFVDVVWIFLWIWVYVWGS
jgi:heme/copper-type cytochrome/quinol oxidase subunit 3